MKRAPWWSLLGLALLVIAMTVARVQRTLHDPNFDARDATGSMKSDPGLLYYLVERVVDAGGAIPADWNADPRIEHPSAYDIPAHLPVAQEFVVAWLRLACGEALPLHVFCLWVAGAFASMALVGVWLLARELTASAGWALLAAFFAATLPAAWRTMGFVLMDEDFSLPFFALHLGLLARAARVRTAASMLLASLALAVALSTWHATSFLFAIEAAAILVVCFVLAVNPLRERWTWSLPIVLFATALLVPFLRQSRFAMSPGMLIVLVLWVEPLGARIRPKVAFRTRLAGGLVGGALICAYFASLPTGDHEHVFALLRAKIEFFGVRPADPLALTPDVRLMWQGPFETLEPGVAWSLLGTALIVAACALVVSFRRGMGDARLFAAALGAVFALGAAWLVTRVVVFPALLLPALAVPVLASVMPRRWALAGAVTLVVVQAALFASWFTAYTNPWYAPPVRQAEIRALIRALPALVPADEAVAADSINSTAILAHTGRRAILSPKWESSASRARVVEFITAFHTLAPADLRALLVGKYRCRYLLVDRVTLGYLCAYTAGLRSFEPRAGSAASVFLSQDAQVLEHVPGYRLLYRSPSSIRQSNGEPADFFRLYALEDVPQGR